MKVSAEAVAGLVSSIYAARYDGLKPTPPFHRTLWDLCCSDSRYVAIAAPRGSAKSTAITHAYVLTCLLFRERKYCLIISDTEEQASEFLVELTAELDENPQIEKFFGSYRVLKRSGTDMIVQMSDGHRFRVIAKGAEQKVRGRKWQQSRPDLVVLDDVENLELTESDARREKLRKWFRKDVLPVGSDDCVFRMVGTILHFDSLLERHMPKEGDPGTKVSPLMDWNYSGLWKSARFRAHPSENDFSELLWPEKLTREYLEALRDDFTRDGEPESYSSEYLNVPVSETSAYFRKADFLPIDGSDWDHNIEYVGAGDLAISQDRKAAFTALGAGGLDEDRCLQVRDVRVARWDAKGIIDEIFSLVVRYKIQDFLLETENISKALGGQIYEQMRKRGVYFNIIPITPSRDKLRRSAPLQHMMRAGSVKYNHDADWFPDLVREMMRFPKGPYKDRVDMLSMMASFVQDLVQAPTDRELEDEEYEEEVVEFGFEGRDAVTGY